MSRPDFSTLTIDPAKMTFQPPTEADLAGPDCRILCFDQTLTSTGFAVLQRRDNDISIIARDTLRSKTEKEGFEGDFDQALQIEQQMEDKVAEWGSIARILIVHETPAVANKRTMAKGGPRVGVSSRMAGQALRSVAKRYGVPVMMLNSQAAKKFVCGNYKADKAEAHASLRNLTWLEGLDTLTNEHQRDAVLLGLLAMMEIS